MKFIKQEQERINKYKPDRVNTLASMKKTSEKTSTMDIENMNNKQKKQEKKIMPDDSMSDITDLEEEEILAKYYRA